MICLYFLRCPSWADDESIAVRNVNNELHFFENNNFGNTVFFCLLHSLCMLYLKGSYDAISSFSFSLESHKLIVYR